MILDRIVIENFRSFYGKNEIKFSIDHQKNVTMVFAANNSGKTNFIDAFKWAFYGKIDGEQPNQIANHLALSKVDNGDYVTASVEIRFKHEGKRYQVERKITESKHDGGGGRIPKLDIFDVYVTNENGETEKSKKPKAIIENILPIGMVEYFFLAGEHIQQLGQEGSKEKIKNAIKMLMGLEIVEKAMKHLGGNVKKRLRDELAKHINVDQQKIIDEQNDLEAKKSTVSLNINTFDQNIESINAQIAAVEKALREGEKTRKLQEKLDSIEAKRDEIKNKLEEINEQLMKKCSNEGYMAFAKDAVSKVQNIVADKRRKGELPANIRYTFVNDLLEMKECICKRTLVEGQNPYNEVRKLLRTEAKPEYESAFNDIATAASGTLSIHERLVDELKKDYISRSNLQDELGMLQDQIQEVNTLFDGKDYESERDLINNKNKLEAKRDELNQDIGVEKNRLKEIEQRIEEIDDELNKAKSQNNIHNRAKKRLELCRKAYGFIDKLHNTLIHRDRKILCERMNQIFKEIIGNREDAIIELTKDFDMVVKVRVPEGGERILPKGGAESQITCLSFIASVVSITKDNMSDSSNLFSRGGIYPIVLDSPFGVMDDDYRKRTALNLPRFGKQIIILVAKQQWDDGIESGLSPHIGSMYKFHRFHPKKHEKQTIQVNGNSYTLAEYVDGDVYTKIEEIE